MKYHFPKRLLSAALTLALLAGLLCTSAFAAGATVNKIEEKAGDDGKITVTVYDRTPDTSVGTGAATTVSDGTPVKGVGINALKIGSVVELTTKDDATNMVTTQVAFGLSGDKVTALGLKEEDEIATYNGTTYFAPEAVQTAVENANQATLEALAAGQESSQKVTGDTGVAEFTGLTYGLYLLAKSELPAAATTDFVPFLVSVPMYVNDSWTQTVYAYPKVRTDKATLTKTVADDDKYVNAGQTIPFTLTATIPATETGNGQAKDFTKFAITDTNAQQTLSIQNATTTGVTVKLNGNVLTAGTDYDTPTYTNGVLTITFTADGLEKLNAKLDEDQTITVTYNATVNTGVTSFNSKLTNSATLTYDRGSGPVTASSSAVNLYTYGIDLTKTLSDASDQIGADQIAFELYEDSNGALGAKVPVTGSNGIYWQAKTEESPAVAMHVTSGSNSGHVKLYGLEPGTYYLKETATQNGYALLDQPITIVISTSGDVSVSDPTVSATVNNADATVSNGVVQLSVTNTKLTAGFRLPQTGGEGTLLVTAIGLGLLCAAVVLLVVYRKKSRN